MTPLLEISGLETHLGGSRILRGVNLAVGPGEIVALMGRNGVGKSTTLRSITGVVPVHAGSIRFAGRELRELPPDERARAGIGYVPQGRDIFPHLTVEENLRVGLVAHGRRGPAARAALIKVPERIATAATRRKRRVRQSTGSVALNGGVMSVGFGITLN